MGFITLYGIRCLDSMLAKNRMSHPNVRIVFSDYRQNLGGLFQFVQFLFKQTSRLICIIFFQNVQTVNG